jgi:hypothetical protein
MKLIRFFAPALLGAALASGAAADEPCHAFECDTPAGHFSYWKRSVSAAAIEIAGNVTANELLKDKKWGPGALVSLKSGKPTKATYGLRVYGVTKTPEFLFLELVKPDGRDQIGLGLIPATKDPIPFTLSLDASGHLKVTVAGMDSSAQVGDFKPDTVELSCSTGDFEFTDVTVKEKAPGPN